MGDTCLSPGALTLVSGVVGALVTAIVALYRARIADKDREIERWVAVAHHGTDQAERSVGLARRAKSGAS